MLKHLCIEHATDLLFQQFRETIEDNGLCIQVGSQQDPSTVISVKDKVFLLAINGRIVLGESAPVSYEELVFTMNGIRIAFNMGEGPGCDECPYSDDEDGDDSDGEWF